jgi:hypothetical protein
MAISKERLEELIEQGATIWTNDFEEIKLDKNTCEVCEVKTLSGEHLYWVFDFEYEFNNVKHNAKFDLDELEEDVEKCRWEREFGCIERRIRLDLPKWEDIEKDKDFHYIRNFIINNNFSFFIEIYKFTNKISIHWSNGCNKTDPRFNKNWELTKENYILACRKAKELFLKGYNND